MSRTRKRSIPGVVLKPANVPLSDQERRLIIETADAMVYQAGRTTLVLALRGSRNKKLDVFKAEELPGFGLYRGKPEEDVLAIVDQLICEGLLLVEKSHDGFPLLGFTPTGLALSEQWTAERWLELLRGHINDSEPFEPPFAYERMPQRNGKTIQLLLDALAREADSQWLPILRQWSSIEVKKVRAKLEQLINRLV